MITITEFLQKKKGDGRILYKYHPKTKDELQDIILDLCKQGIYDLNCIDTSEITDMSELFDIDIDAGIGEKIDMSKINISNWDVSNVTNMFCMFYNCRSFNDDLSNWDVSNVVKMNGMFYECESFDCDLSNWDVSNVVKMNSMFCGCKKFNSDLSNWDVSKVKDMSFMYDGCPAPKPKWYKF